MDDQTFDRWLVELDLNLWGTGQHKVTATQFFEQGENEGAALLDLRSQEEVGELAIPFALHIPIHELPSRKDEIPADRLVATFCSSVTRAVVAWTYLQLQGIENIRILDANYSD
jgi:rhodanese-related sulfurtransferase